MKSLYFVPLLIIGGVVLASPQKEMNTALEALSELIPYLNNVSEFQEKKNELSIKTSIEKLTRAIKNSKHDSLIKTDLFSPSLKLLMSQLDGTTKSFKEGKKYYSHWRLNQVASLCIDCHARIPKENPSSFESQGKKLDTSFTRGHYQRGTLQLLTRQYQPATESFNLSLEEGIKEKNDRMIEESLKQILLIQIKILRKDSIAIKAIDKVISSKTLSKYNLDHLEEWKKDLIVWKGRPTFQRGIASETDLKSFLEEVEKKASSETGSFTQKNDLNLLVQSGLLSNYLFLHPDTESAAEINYWIGRNEIRLKKDNFFSSGDLFLRQCIRKYSKKAIAKRCMKELREDIEFQFTGSMGTAIPDDVEQELKRLDKMLGK